MNNTDFKADIRVQTKYCYTEQELNDFLNTLHTSDLYCIQFLPVAQVSGTNDSVDGSSRIVGIVEYFARVRQ